MPPMKLKKQLRSWKRGTFKTIRLIAFVLFVAALIVRFTFWFYENYKQGLGDSLAQVAIAYQAIFYLVLVLIGLGLGFGIEWLILHRKFIFHDIQTDSLAEWLVLLWGIELPVLKKEPELSKASEPIPLQYLNHPTRRGRKPTFTLERWLPIAAKWENRDPMRDAFTLAELIAEYLGTNPDGSPIVSEQTYYSLWRARAIEELKRRSKS